MLNYLIKRNKKVHNKIANKYEFIHSEIFNNVEQNRLFSALKIARDLIRTSSSIKSAFDFGCGSGNLTKHLINLEFKVVSGDVSQNFLNIIKKKYGYLVKTLQLNGVDLSNIKDDYFDLVATYSVLHHIPNYIDAIAEMVRITKPGGIIFIDHERNENYWDPNSDYINFSKQIPSVPKKILRYLKLKNFKNKLLSLLNPRYSEEGDIHVWPDDHIEWHKIEKILNQSNCTVIIKADYLLYKSHYPMNIYLNFKNKINDTRLLIARKTF